MSPFKPFPAIDSKFSTSSNSRLWSFLYWTNVCAIGCLDLDSMEQAILSISALSYPSHAWTSFISSLPSVKVPVLSNKTSLILAYSSIYSPPLIIIPFLVPLVIADTMDTGVDITKAHGQEITKSVNAL